MYQCNPVTTPGGELVRKGRTLQLTDGTEGMVIIVSPNGNAKVVYDPRIVEKMRRRSN